MSSADSPVWTSLTPTQLIDQILLAKADMPDFDLGRLSAEIDERISFYEIQLREEFPSSGAFVKFSLTSKAFGFEDQVSTIIKLIDPEVSASWPDILRWYVPASLSEILGWEVFASWSEMPRWEISSFLSVIPILAAGLVMYVLVITLTLLMSTSPTNSLWVENRHVLLSTATRLVLILAMSCFILYSVPALLKIRDNVGYEKSVSHAIKNVHWTAVGLVLMDVALKFAETDESEKNCLTLLNSMNELSKLILKFQEFPRLKMEFHATLNKSIQLLVKGAILCYSWKKKILRLNGRKKLQHLSRDIDDMCKKMTDALQGVRSSSTFNPDSVLEDLRALQPETYDPTRVGLGIYHHEMSPYSSEMGEIKVKTLCTTVKRLKNVTVDNLVGEIQKLDFGSRNRYKNSRGSLPKETLAWNITLDACFLLEFFRSLYWFSNYTVEREIVIDIFKLENQVPLFILIKILELEFQTPEKAITKLASMLCMQPQFAILPFSLMSKELEILQAEVEANMKENPLHMLHLVSKTVEAFLTPSNIPMNDADANIVNDCMDFMSSIVYRDANILQKFLIRFKPSKDGQVRFKIGWFGSSVLYLPQIFLFEETEPLLWNFIAFAVESESNMINHFIFFLNSLIRSNKMNIALLRQAQIIISKKSDEEVETMFHNLSNVICGSCGPFENVQSQISEHYNSFNKGMLWFTSLPLEIAFIGFTLLFLVVVSRFFIR